MVGGAATASLQQEVTKGGNQTGSPAWLGTCPGAPTCSAFMSLFSSIWPSLPPNWARKGVSAMLRAGEERKCMHAGGL